MDHNIGQYDAESLLHFAEDDHDKCECKVTSLFVSYGNGRR